MYIYVMINKNGVNFQVYINKNLKNKSEEIARKNGFDSLQDLVRFFLANVVNGQFVPSVQISKAKNDKPKSSVTFRHEESVTFESEGIIDDDLQITYAPIRILEGKEKKRKKA